MTIKPDPHNANQGTERGTEIIEQSLRKYGAGRSILIDKNDVAIAGNKTLEKAVQLGLKIQVVESDGSTLIAVRRNDLDLDEAPARELALMDNRSSELNLSWDETQLGECALDPTLDLSIGWNRMELRELRDIGGMDEALPPPPSTGNFDSAPLGSEFVIHLLIPKETHDLYEHLMDKLDGPPHQRFRQILLAAADGLDSP